MKILCDRQQLQEAFGVVAAIAPLKTPKPIVKNVLLEASEDRVTFFATDFEMSGRVELDSVKVKEPGKCLLPARETSALLRELNDPTVTLESQEFRCTLEGGGGSFVLVGDDPEQFPQQIRLDDGRKLELPAADFVDMARKTAFAAAKEETRYAINGVLIDSRDAAVKFVATDGRRLALAYRNVADDVPAAQVVVPLRALLALTRAIPEDSDEPLTMILADNQAGFRFGKTLLVTQLLDANFPDYEGVVPRAADTTVEISRDLLESNLRKVAILSSGDVRMVRFQFGSSSLRLSAESSGVGRADLEMDVDVKGAGGAIGFNSDYLLDALKVADLEVIRLDMTDDSTPAKLTMGESFTYVLMPISS